MEEKFKTIPYEPKMNNRFVVEFPKEFELEPWHVTKINKPSFVNNEWGDIKIEFVDPISPSASQGLYKIIDLLKMENHNDYIFEININSLDPIGDVIEKWKIYVNKVLMINFGMLDYTDNSIQTPYLIVKPYKCDLTI